ncbi:3-hydroxyacyl-CoA dehydrogenase NAD-binding domain-containing protein [Bradyrhizobium sp. RD5-C2]|uniref:3-hydroxyacyl-CoA dehydrogenase NAD-binding domain-containing protein n=1 Tax=Bradyrhizobium sp. RD5-C2 TaxID=244562 RepID=UPI001CC4374E|nr:3-hydroxyacyl-CoA dehydrogenase NAD-binding domain-containing protein [Bradyrhizobium sp. RD5-C2]GIQ78284.1 hypothetical protein BraRD5C2_67340 [Bradyrhizobium sp. RD5-C2]
MTGTKPIRRIAVIGTGVMGASWTSLFPARGLQMVESDGAQNAETAKATVRRQTRARFGEDIL